MKAKVIFTQITQASQNIGPDEHLLAELTMVIKVGDRDASEHKALVKSPAGAKYAGAPLEITMPKDYRGPFDYEKYRKCAEEYYRSWFQIDTGGQEEFEVAMSGNIIEANYWCEFEVAEQSEGW